MMTTQACERRCIVSCRSSGTSAARRAIAGRDHEKDGVMEAPLLPDA